MDKKEKEHLTRIIESLIRGEDGLTRILLDISTWGSEPLIWTELNYRSGIRDWEDWGEIIKKIIKSWNSKWGTIFDRVDDAVKENRDYESIAYRDANEYQIDGDYEDMLRMYIKFRGYHLKYEFWSDGCNYASTGFVRMRYRSPENEECRHGSIWRSDVWKF